MRRLLVMTAIAGAILTTSAALTSRADAMTISAPAAVSKVTTNAGPVQQVRWRGGWRRGWHHRYWGAYGYYRPWRWRHRWW
jgi:hypothetical protein